MSKCRDCGRTFLHGDYIIYGALGSYCANRKNCFNKRKIMPNIKITAEVDGKQVPLETVSTETFEAIKALEKPKEIPVPVARLAKRIHPDFNEPDPPLRLLITLTEKIKLNPGRVYSFNIKNGALVAEWELTRDEYAITHTYENVRPL